MNKLQKYIKFIPNIIRESLVVHFTISESLKCTIDENNIKWSSKFIEWTSLTSLWNNDTIKNKVKLSVVHSK